MTRKPAGDVRPGDWLVDREGEAHRVTKVEFSTRGVAIAAPPWPPTPHRLDEPVVVATRPPTCRATWDDATESWVVMVYVPDSTIASVRMGPDHREQDRTEGDEE